MRKKDHGYARETEKPSIAAQAAAREAWLAKLPDQFPDGLVEGSMSAKEVEDLIDG
ncbi:hypothetical protein [Paralcaligenes ginsengisoli]